MRKQEVDARNAEFWNELCGSNLARSLGITELSYKNLRRFDEAYLAFYPYLAQYVLKEDLRDKKVLEIGLGYGTLGSFLVSQRCDYCGIDIANGPLGMMRYRLSCPGPDQASQLQKGSALELPYKSESFDYVYTIGCLHHTGNLTKSVSEVHRVLKPSGKAIVMLYNRHSYRQILQVPLIRLRSLFSGSEQREFARRVRALYDTNESGEAAPHTDYVSRAEVGRLFKDFLHVRTEVQNFATHALFKEKLIIRREKLLNNLGRVLGLDLYITATK
jgi:ubiquinone/menaquinone biosynthesis C-methylase UbiE